MTRLLAMMAVLALLLVAACAGEPVEQPEERETDPTPTEAQSDLLELGVGLEWLSFLPDDRRLYPGCFQGLNQHQARRLRLAPKSDNNRVMIAFDLPEGAKIWPVQWYGKELVAIDLPGAGGYSVAVAAATEAPLADLLKRLHEAREPGRNGEFEVTGDESAAWTRQFPAEPQPAAVFGAKRLGGRVSNLLVVVECRPGEIGEPLGDRHAKGLKSILNGISLRRELALEGLPSHKCTSSITELGQGLIRFPSGALQFLLNEGQSVRKTGGRSTIEVHADFGSPWLLMRRLEQTDLEGDTRVRLRADPAVSRRLKAAGTNFGAGRRLDKARLPVVVFDYKDRRDDHSFIAVLACGEELLLIETASPDLITPEERIRAKTEAIRLLQDANSPDTTTEDHGLEVLEGWNPGTMGYQD